ncbi:unnamed protein product [Rotaria sp. Silwood1]|nr:unnamed protein product [Rotaria sp. Silwood1]
MFRLIEISSEPSRQSGVLRPSRKNDCSIHCPLVHRYSLSLHSFISSCQQCSSSNSPSRQSSCPLKISLQSKHAGKGPRLHYK